MLTPEENQKYRNVVHANFDEEEIARYERRLSIVPEQDPEQLVKRLEHETDFVQVGTLAFGIGELLHSIQNYGTLATHEGALGMALCGIAGAIYYWRTNNRRSRPDNPTEDLG